MAPKGLFKEQQQQQQTLHDQLYSVQMVKIFTQARKGKSIVRALSLLFVPYS